MQSTVLALMAHRGDLPKLDAAIFADPGEESDATYAHLKWLIKEVAPSFKVLVRSIGRLGDNVKCGVNSTGGRFLGLPTFQSERDGECVGISRRQCTKEYKTNVVERCIRRDVLGLEPRQRIPKEVWIEQWLGMSLEEARRVANVRAIFAEHRPRSTPRFPLFELGMTRRDCVKWLADYGVPHEVPRSACVFCPFKSNEEWRLMHDNDPKGWARAIEIDEHIRKPGVAHNRKMNRTLWLHRSCVPLAEADLRESDARSGQLGFGFSAECEGMCGV